MNVGEQIRNEKLQYEMLGRFVEAFESMVDQIRSRSIELASRDSRNKILLEVIMNHSALSTKPVMDIFRAIVAECFKDALQEEQNDKTEPPLLAKFAGKELLLTIRDRDVLLGVLSHIAGKYEALVNKRNDLLHGTWFVGLSSEDDPMNTFFTVRKLKTSKTGLVSAREMPQHADHLKDLAEQCNDVENWVSWIDICLEGALKITNTFQFSQNDWWLVLPAGERSTLR